jgi:hypothetical protein
MTSSFSYRVAALRRRSRRASPNRGGVEKAKHCHALNQTQVKTKFALDNNQLAAFVLRHAQDGVSSIPSKSLGGTAMTDPA